MRKEFQHDNKVKWRVHYEKIMDSGTPVSMVSTMTTDSKNNLLRKKVLVWILFCIGSTLILRLGTLYLDYEDRWIRRSVLILYVLLCQYYAEKKLYTSKGYRGLIYSLSAMFVGTLISIIWVVCTNG